MSPVNFGIDIFTKCKYTEAMRFEWDEEKRLERQMTVKKRDLKTQSLTDWKRIDSMKDENIDLSEIPELDDNFFKNAELVLPKPKVVVTLRVDADVMEWFRTKGKGYQTMMNAVLKGWVEQHRT